MDDETVPSAPSDESADSDDANPDRDQRQDEPTRHLNLSGSFGTAVGAAMLGFEQALRREPPAEVRAAEHAPERALSGADDGIAIEIPEPLTRPERTASARQGDR